jgi:hypothetical protein
MGSLAENYQTGSISTDRKRNTPGYIRRSEYLPGKSWAAVRIAIHLLNDKYQTHITKAQQIAATELSLDESNSYMHNLLQAITDVAEFADLSLHVEWKLVQAEAVFPQDGEHAPTLLVEFVTDWISAEPDSRNQLVEDWQSGKLPAKNRQPERGCYRYDGASGGTTGIPPAVPCRLHLR